MQGKLMVILLAGKQKVGFEVGFGIRVEAGVQVGCRGW